MLAYQKAPPATIFSDGTYSKRNTLRSVESSDDGDCDWRNSQWSVLTDLTEAPFQYDDVLNSEQVKVSTVYSSKLLHTQTTADVWTDDLPVRSASVVSVSPPLSRIIIPSSCDLEPKPLDWPLSNTSTSLDSTQTLQQETEQVVTRLSLPPAAYDIALSLPRPVTEVASRSSNIIPGWARAYYSKGMSLPTTPSTIAALANTSRDLEICIQDSTSSSDSSISRKLEEPEGNAPAIYPSRIWPKLALTQISQMVLFCLGFICPLMWIIGALLPLPNYIGRADIDAKHAFVYRESFLYWRMVNRCMTVAGIVLSGIIIGLAVYGAKG